MIEGARPPFSNLSWTGSLANFWILHAPGSLKEGDPWAVIRSHPSTAFLVVNDDLQCHRINQVGKRRRTSDVPDVMRGFALSAYKWQT